MEIAISTLRHHCKLLLTLDRPRQGGCDTAAMCAASDTSSNIMGCVHDIHRRKRHDSQFSPLDAVLCLACAKSLLLGFLIHCDCDLCLTHMASIIGGTYRGSVHLGRCVLLVASPVRSVVLLCTLPVCRVRVAWIDFVFTGIVSAVGPVVAPACGSCADLRGQNFIFWCPAPL